MTSALPDFQYNLKQNTINAAEKKGKKTQLDIIQYLKNAFMSYYICHLVKKILLENFLQAS